MDFVEEEDDDICGYDIKNQCAIGLPDDEIDTVTLKLDEIDTVTLKLEPKDGNGLEDPTAGDVPTMTLTFVPDDNNVPETKVEPKLIDMMVTKDKKKVSKKKISPFASRSICVGEITCGTGVRLGRTITETTRVEHAPVQHLCGVQVRQQMISQGRSLEDISKAVGLYGLNCSFLGNAIDRIGLVPLSSMQFAGFLRRILSEAAGISGKTLDGAPADDAGGDDASVATRSAVEELFRAFDTNGNGTLERHEVAGGLSALCAATSTPQQRTDFVFRAYDNNGDGLLSRAELTAYFTSVFKVLFQFEDVDNTREHHGIRSHETPEQVAAETVDEAFARLDKDGDGRLSIPEFERFFMDIDDHFGADPLETALASVSCAMAALDDLQAWLAKEL